MTKKRSVATKRRPKPAAAEAAPATESACVATGKVITSWRDLLQTHPAAELFPLMPPDELKETAEDIKKNGLLFPIALWRAAPGAQLQLLDGRNRLDAIEIVAGGPVELKPAETIKTANGRPFPFRGGVGVKILDGRKVDPYAYVAAANLHRRHLTAEQKRDSIAKLLKAQPEKSNRQIAAMTKAHHETVGAVRTELEGRGEIRHVDERKDTKGRKQPARKSAKASKGKEAKAKGTKEAKSTKAAKGTKDAKGAKGANGANGANGTKAPDPPPPVSDEVLRQRAAAAEKIRELRGGSPGARSDVGTGADDAGRLRERIRELEIKIAGFESAVEEAKAGAHLDADVRSFLDALIARVSMVDGEEERKTLFGALHEALRVRKELLAAEGGS